MKEKLIISVVSSMCVVIVIIGALSILPIINIRLGKFTFEPSSSVTVVGFAQKEQTNEIAQFSAGINVVKDTKEAAVSEANQKINAVTDSVKTFGISSDDIKTENLNVYQMEESYWEDGRQKTRSGQWRVNNTVTVKLRDATRASELADLLTRSGANNIYGPNFISSDRDTNQNELLTLALKDAREKAEILAKSSSKSLGTILVISEGSQGSVSPMFAFGEGKGGGGGSDLQPGSTTVQKSITVTFELR